MGTLGAGKQQITGLAPDARADYLTVRAERLEWTRSKLVTRILEMWFEAGMPPVSHADALLPKLLYPLAAPNEHITTGEAKASRAPSHRV